MTPDKFKWTVNMLKSPLWELLAEVEGTMDSILFHMPNKCLTTQAPICQQAMVDSQQQDTNKENAGDSSNQQDLDSLALLQPFGAENSKKRRGGKTPLVETEVRRMIELKKIMLGLKEVLALIISVCHVMLLHQLFRNQWLRMSQPHFARWLIRNWRESSLRSPSEGWERTWLGCSHPMRTGTTTPKVSR